VSGRALPPPLIALTPGDLVASRFDDFLASVDAAVGAGLRAILVREPEMSDRGVLELALQIGRRLPRDGYLMMHDRAYLVERCGARAVHLGFRSLTPRQVREIVGAEVAVGLSAHANDAPSEWKDADYLFFGPVFETPSKRGLLAPVGIEGLRCAVTSTSVPVFAIGGITAENVGLVAGGGARGFAVLRGVFGMADPAGAVGGYERAFRHTA
jgi:thiamine-phosphate diphosphorylase